MGFLDSDNVVPSIGNDAWQRTADGAVTLGLEGSSPLGLPRSPVFASFLCFFGFLTELAGGRSPNTVFQCAGTLTIVQQRSAYAPQSAGAFAAELAAWIDECAFSRVLVLSSADAGARMDQQVASEGFALFLRSYGVRLLCPSALTRTPATPIAQIERSSVLMHLGGGAVFTSVPSLEDPLRQHLLSRSFTGVVVNTLQKQVREEPHPLVASPLRSFTLPLSHARLCSRPSL